MELVVTTLGVGRGVALVVTLDSAAAGALGTLVAFIALLALDALAAFGAFLARSAGITYARSGAADRGAPRSGPGTIPCAPSHSRLVFSGSLERCILDT